MVKTEIFFRGKKFISSATAASIFGYTHDYMGQLCRLNKISARKCGRNWFVLEESVKKHKEATDELARLTRLGTLSAASKVSESDGSILAVNSIPEPESIISPHKPLRIKSEVLNSVTIPSKKIETFKRELPLILHLGALGRAKSVMSSMREEYRTALSRMSRIARGDWGKKIVSLAIAIGIVATSFAAYSTIVNADSNDFLVRIFKSAGGYVSKTIASATHILETGAGESYLGITKAADEIVSKKSVVAIVALPSEFFSKFKKLFLNFRVGVEDTASKIFGSGDRENFLVALAPDDMVSNIATGIGDAVASGYGAVKDTVSQSLNSVRGKMAGLFGLFGPAETKIFIKRKPPLVVKQPQPVEPAAVAPSAPRSIIVTAPANVVEKVTERIVSVSGISRDEVEQLLQQLNNKLSSEIYSISAAGDSNKTYINNVYNTVAQTNKIDKLHTVDIDGSLFTDGRIVDSTFTGGSISCATITGLSGDFSGGISVGGALAVTGATSLTGALTAASGVFSSNLGIGGMLAASSTLLVTDLSRFYGGFISSASSTVGSDLTVSGTLTTNNLSVSNGITFSNTGTTAFGGGIRVTGGIAVSDYVETGMVMATSTTATSTFAGGLNANLLNITSTTATSTFSNGIILTRGCFLLPNGQCAGTGTGSGGAFTSLGGYTTLNTISDFVGIGTSTPYAKFAVEGSSSLGNIALAGYFVATSTTATSTFAGGLVVQNGGIKIGTVLNCNAGSVLETDANGVVTCGLDAGALGVVSSVSNADGTLTISPTSGDVVSSLNLNA